jgi:hypothetical protein
MILHPSPGLLFSGRAQATLHHEHFVARGTYRASVIGEPPIGRNVVFCGLKIFSIGRHDTRALATRTVS